MTEVIDVASWSSEALRADAAMFQHDNYSPGDTGYCPAGSADWHYEPALSVAALEHLVNWKTWFAGEIEMDETDQLGRGYRAMLSEDIQEAIVVLMVDGKGYIWDGWHRTGATIACGRATLKAIVGVPRNV